MNKLNPTSVEKHKKATFLLLVLCVALLAIYSLVQNSVSQNASNPFILDEEATKDAQETPSGYSKPLKKLKQKPSATKTPKKTFTYWFIESETEINFQRM